MSYKNLFNIIFKVLGIFVIKDFLKEFSQLFTSIYYFFTAGNSGDVFFMLSYPVTSSIFYGLVIYFLIFKTNYIIDKLSLLEDFVDEKFELKIHRSTILQIVILIISITVLIDSVPVLIANIIEYIRQSEYNNGPVSYNLSFQPTFVSILKILIAYLLISNQKRLVNWIELKRKS